MRRSNAKIGDRFGRLVISSTPYYLTDGSAGEHRRQHVDCICDCGNTRKSVNWANLKRGAILTYCGYDCQLYKDALPKEVPESSKLCKLKEKYNKLTVIEEAYYEKQKGEANRHKCVRVQCECGKIKSYREDKVYKGDYKSCGCTWEYSGNNSKRDKHLQRTYGLSPEDYERILESQNHQCAICKTSDQTTRKTRHFFVDHCHETGVVRGLLCDACNRGLGYFKDKTTSLLAAVSYLQR